MNRKLLFFIGFGSGALAMFVTLFLIAFFLNSREDRREEAREEMIERYEQFREELKPDVQYFELTGRNGAVTLHTLMPKDSVKILMGKPSNTSISSYGRTTRETWKYHFEGRGLYGTTLTTEIEFVDGKLDSVMEL